MASEVRTVLKDFNRELIRDQIDASVLPFESMDLAGFVRKGNSQFVGEPAPGPKVIRHDKVADTQDIAQPGEIRFEFTTALTVAQGAILDALLNAHDATEHTASQDRSRQDVNDYVTLELQHPNIDAMTNAQFRQYVSTLARAVIRANRDANL
jgi:hypothetical protein